MHSRRRAASVTRRSPRELRRLYNHPPGSKLISAIIWNDLPLFEALLGRGDLNVDQQCGENGLTALHWAAKLGRIEFLKLLLPQANLVAQDDRSRTPFFYAVEANNALEVVELLVETGMSVTSTGRSSSWKKYIGATLLLAAKRRKFDVVKKLLELDKTTLLDAVRRCTRSDAASSTKVIIVRRLVENGADVRNSRLLLIAAEQGCLALFPIFKDYPELAEERDTKRLTALHIAAECGWDDIVDYLLEQYPVDIEATTDRNWTALHLAASGGHSAIVSRLIQKDANVVPRTKSGYTPVFVACFNEHDEVAMRLLDAMTKQQAFSVDNEARDTLLRVAATWNCPRVVRRLLQYAVEDGNANQILSELQSGCTVAYVAILLGHLATVSVLLEYNALIEGKDRNGNQALHWAAVHGMSEAVHYLVGHRQAVHWWTMVNNKGETPVELAARGSHGDIVSFLLERQDPRRIEGVNTSGWQALHWAAWYERLDLVRVLMKQKADVSAKDSEGRIPADLVHGNGSESIEMLEWLTPPELHNSEPPSITLTRPSPAAPAETICKSALVHLVGVYPSCAIAKSELSVHSVLYQYGPKEILAAVSAGQGVVEQLSFRWIHMPANNKTWTQDLVQSIYFDRIKPDGSYHRQSTDLIKPLSPVSVHGFEGSSTQASGPGDSSSEKSDLEDDGFQESDSDSVTSAGSQAEENGSDIHDHDVTLSAAEVITTQDTAEEDNISINDVDDAQHLSRTMTPRELVMGEQPERVLVTESSSAGPQVNIEIIGGSSVVQNPPRAVHVADETRESDAADETRESDATEEDIDLAADEERKLYFRLQSFVKDCLSQDIGSRQARFMRPFFKAYDSESHYASTSGTSTPISSALKDMDLLGSRILFSFPYITFTKTEVQVKMQRIICSTLDEMTTPDQGPGENIVLEPWWQGDLIRHYMDHEGSSLYVPVTLDQFYYHSLPDTEDRTTGQVLYRHQAQHIPEGQNRLVCMIDQFWLQILDDGTVVTSCWKQQGADAPNLQKAISDHLIRDKDGRPDALSAYAMIPLIMEVCVSKSIDWAIGQGRERLLDIFGTAVARAANEEVKLFDKFFNNLDEVDGPLPRDRKHLNGAIRSELDLLKEVKDILDELNIIKAVFLSQESVMYEAYQFLKKRRDRNVTDMLNNYHTQAKLDMVFQELDELINHAKQTQEDVNRLLDLRQKDANLSEAVWARKASEDTEKQGKTIMVFTIVTIVFLPITFLTSLFALDITSFPHDSAGNLTYRPDWAFPLIFGITIAVSVPLIALALFVNQIGEFFSRLSWKVKQNKPKDNSTASGSSSATLLNREGETVDGETVNGRVDMTKAHRSLRERLRRYRNLREDRAQV